jgi:hypothetical protein
MTKDIARIYAGFSMLRPARQRDPLTTARGYGPRCRRHPAGSSRRRLSGRARSLPISTPARQYPHDINDAGLGIAGEADPPVANTETPFVGVHELRDISGRRIASQPIECINHSPLNWAVEALEVTSGACREGPAAVAQATSRLISSAESTSPRAICSAASRAPSSSSGVVGSSSTGALSSRSASASRLFCRRTMKPSASCASASESPSTVCFNCSLAVMPTK